MVDPSDHTSRNVLGKHLDYKEDKVIFDKINKKIEQNIILITVKNTGELQTFFSEPYKYLTHKFFQERI